MNIEHLKYLHEKWSKSGSIGGAGLCNVLNTIEFSFVGVFKDIFFPTQEEFNKLIDADESIIFWGSGLPVDTVEKSIRYTPRRESMVLLLIEILSDPDFVRDDYKLPCINE